MKCLGWLLSATALTAMIAMTTASPPDNNTEALAKNTAAVTAEEEAANAYTVTAMLQSVNEEVAKKKADVETQYAAHHVQSPTARGPAHAATIVVGNAVRTLNVAKKATIRHPLLA